MFVPFHKHILLKATFTGTGPESKGPAQDMLYDVVKALGMRAVTEPQAVYVSDPGNEGLTGSINLATSHVAFHVWDKTKLLMADVYSCKDFNHQDALDVFEEYFGEFKNLQILIVDRDTMEVKVVRFQNNV